jgi:GAF domain-containing protein
MRISQQDVSGKGGMLVQQMTSRLRAEAEFEQAIRVILADAIALHGAEYGNIQLLAGDHLVIAAQYGFKRPFLEVFRQVRAEAGCACGRALKTGRTIVIQDTETDEAFAPYRAAARAAGFRSVTTMPLVTTEGIVLGAVSVHFVKIHVPTRIELDTLQSYGTAAADHLHALLGAETLESKALSM